MCGGSLYSLSMVGQVLALDDLCQLLGHFVLDFLKVLTEPLKTGELFCKASYGFPKTKRYAYNLETHTLDLKIIM